MSMEIEYKKMNENNQLNAINLYMYGLILKQNKNKEESREIFI